MPLGEKISDETETLSGRVTFNEINSDTSVDSSNNNNNSLNDNNNNNNRNNTNKNNNVRSVTPEEPTRTTVKATNDTDNQRRKELMLFIAAHLGHLDMMKHLVEVEGVDANSTTQLGYTPLHACVAGGWYECIDFLIHHGARLIIKVGSLS